VSAPDVSVVFATRDRADRLEQLLAGLRRQQVDGRFEVIVVDDGSRDRTPAILAAEQERGELDLRHHRHETSHGPAAARNRGWHDARAPFVVFTDDDCVPVEGWLAALYAAWEGDENRFVQGSVAPNPAEADREGPFTRTLRVDRLGPFFQTANVAYPRELLERVAGFDEITFSIPGGEDADLAHRCIEAGATPVFVAHAATLHAVHVLGPVAKLKVAWRWHETVRLYARHPAMRKTLTYGVFWKKTHYLLVRALIGLLLPRRLAPLRFWFFAPLAPYYWQRSGTEGHGARWAAGYFLIYDAVELAGIARGAIRYRTLVL
jgi:glycosyltransferase involved in cell wall biosynthesis